MAQNITLMGATYQDVPKIILPKAGGGDAEFVDVTEIAQDSSSIQSGTFEGTGAISKTITLEDTSFTEMLVFKESGSTEGYSIIGCFKPSSGSSFGIRLNSTGASNASLGNILSKTATGFSIAASSTSKLSSSCTYRWYVWAKPEESRS